MPKLEAIQVDHTTILTLLEIVTRYDSSETNWSSVRKEWLMLGNDLTELYRVIPACERLGLISYEERKYIKLELNGKKMLDTQDPKRFLGMLLIQWDRRDKVLEAILRAYDKSHLVRGIDFVKIDEIADCMRELQVSVESSTLTRNLSTVYESAELVECREGEIRMNVKRYKELSGKKIGRGKEEITDEEFFTELVNAYDHIFSSTKRRYVPIPEIRRYVCYKLDADSYEEVFDDRLRKKPGFHFRGRTILLVSPRGPREGSIRGLDGRSYQHVLVTQPEGVSESQDSG